MNRERMREKVCESAQWYVMAAQKSEKKATKTQTHELNENLNQQQKMKKWHGGAFKRKGIKKEKLKTAKYENGEKK